MTNVERFTRSLASKEARLEKTRERMAKRAVSAEAKLSKARMALAKAQARVEAAEAALAKTKVGAETLITKQTEDVSKARERLEAAHAAAQAKAIPAPSAARVTAAPRASRPKDWVISHEAADVAVPPGIRSSLNAFLRRRARVTLDNEFAGRLFDVLGIDQAQTLLLTIPGRKGYVATVVEGGLEFVRE
jgi:hypothetical protein